MPETIATALVGLVGTVAGALITVYSEEIKALFMGNLSRNNDLRGAWNCKWEQSIPKTAAAVADTVTIEKTSAVRIRAVGRTQGVGSYRLVGRISQANLVTLFYEGIEARKRSTGGVVILELKPSRDRLEGQWLEYTNKREFIGGPTVWTKS